MKWATAVSRKTSFEEAVLECAGVVRAELGPGPVTVAFAFVTPHFAEFYDGLYETLNGALAPQTLLGCSAGGVIGGGEEIEQSPAVTLTAARLPDVVVRPFHLEDSLPDPDGPPDAWEDLVGVKRTEEPQFVLLADPFSTRSEALLAGLDFAFPGAAKIGGLASGATSPGLNALFLNDKVYTEGVIGASFTGDVVVDTVVAQGCRPVGELMQVTASDGNILRELEGRPALEVLRELFSSMDEEERRLAGTSLFIGVLMDEFAEDAKVGDFLIRNLVGIDPKSGALGVGERLQEGMRVRFHLRDAKTSAEDLHTMLTGYENTLLRKEDLSGALFFSCLGRGEHLYGEPNFDTGIFKQHLGDLPVGGFFCNGEIGPVGGETFLHGYTSSFGLFRPRVPDTFLDEDAPDEGELGDPEPIMPGREPELPRSDEPREPEPLA
ncbi:MAG: FIST C-terminal domain-containing protein [Actinomycetota bacterium]|nr:FIST C-terminal domain-containing protein [Actinomycetota bacterium]